MEDESTMIQKADVLERLLNTEDTLNQSDRDFIFNYFTSHSSCFANKSNGVTSDNNIDYEIKPQSPCKRKLFEDEEANNKKLKYFQDNSFVNGVDTLFKDDGFKSISKKEVQNGCVLKKTAFVNKVDKLLDDNTTKSVSTNEKVIQCNALGAEIISAYLSNEEQLLQCFNQPPEEQNSTQLSKLLRHSFAMRRAFITSSSNCSVKICKDLYPYLFSLDHIFKEFEFITKKEKFYHRFVQNVDIYKKFILEHSPVSPVHKKIQTRIENASEDQVSWLKQAGSLLMLSQYMKEERTGLLLLQNEQIQPRHGVKPYIQCDGDVDSILDKRATFKVFSGCIEICQPNNVLEAYFALMASYCVFNKRYSSNCLNTFILLEELYTEYSGYPKRITTNLQHQIELIKSYLIKNELLSSDM